MGRPSLFKGGVSGTGWGRDLAVRNADFSKHPSLTLPLSKPGCVSQMWPALGLSAGAIPETFSTISVHPLDGTWFQLLELLNARQLFPEATRSLGFPGPLILGFHALREK